PVSTLTVPWRSLRQRPLLLGREELVSGPDGTLPSWYRDPAKTGRDGKREDHRLLSSKGPTEDPQGSLFPRNHRKQQRQTTKQNREPRSEFLWNTLISSKSLE